MEKIIKAGSSIFEPIDKFYDHFWEYDLRLYGVEPHLIWEMSRPSNILKSNVARSRVSWWLYWMHPLNKLWRSLKRHAYLIQHKSEFYPAELPQEKPGKTKRMKF
jgi:glycosyl transferase family 25